jgi:low affinity Fe/Cu permease
LIQNSENNQEVTNKQNVDNKEIKINEEIPQDEVKTKDIVTLKYGEDHVITRAKARLEHAEVKLKQMEKFCSFLLES